MTEKKNNPIDPKLEKVSVPQRNGDDFEIKNPKTPAGDKLTEDKTVKFISKNISYIDKL